jgi:hypothetical protein
MTVREPTRIETADRDWSDVESPPPSRTYLLVLAVLCLAGWAGLGLMALAEWMR